MKSLIKSGALTALLTTLNLSAFAQGTAFTYQGRLNSGSSPANGSYDLTFALYDAPSAGATQGNAITNITSAVSNGLFTVTLDFGSQFPGANRWLEIAVRTNGNGVFSTLAPRQALTATPYAVTAGNISGVLAVSQLPAGVVTNGAAISGTFTGNGANVTNVNAATLGGVSSAGFWQTNGNAGANPTNGAFLGTADNLPLEFKVNGQRGLRLEPGGGNSVNVIGGWSGNSVAPGIVGATVAGGGAGNYLGSASSNRVEANFGSIIGGYQNTIRTFAHFSTIGGGYINDIQTFAAYATIGGGINNTIQENSLDATIGGGGQNTIQTNSGVATISGGSWNIIQTDASESTIGGGSHNTIQTLSAVSTISGGHYNIIETNSFASTIGGGVFNTIQTNSYYSVIGGGSQNSIQPSTSVSTIAGGSFNTIRTNSSASTIGGGSANFIQPNSPYSTIGGGTDHTIQSFSDYSTIGGGNRNTIQRNSGGSMIGGGGFNNIQISAFNSTIGGGINNTIQTNSSASTIGGGNGNIIQTNSIDSTIGGGLANTIQPDSSYATIPGGYLNQATSFAFASGRRAKAIHTGAFVWADSTDADFASTATNQFLIRASGGVGIGSSAPKGLLEIQGGADSSGNFDGRSIALAYFGGGYRHWIRSRHNSFALAGNSIDFFVNTGSTPEGSTGPGTNNVLGLTIDAANGGSVGVGTSTPNASLHVASSAGFPSAQLQLSQNNSSDSSRLRMNVGANPYWEMDVSSGATPSIGWWTSALKMNLDFNGNLMVAGNVTANGAVTGNGSGLTALNAGNLVSGSLSDARLSANVALRAGGNTFSGNQTINGSVGIGTASPAQLLQVGDATVPNSQGMMRFASRSGTGGAYRNWDVGVPETDEVLNSIGYSFVIDDPLNGTGPEMIIKYDTGNVGIGVTNPATKLQVGGVVSAAASSSEPFEASGAASGYALLDRSTGAAGRWVMFATGGTLGFYSGGTTRMSVSAGGTVTATAFNPPSDRNLKENFVPVSPQEVLEKVAGLPISRWNFKEDKATPHVGPMAQDFHAAFGLGTDERHIATVDADGVALAAIQGLNEKLEVRSQLLEAKLQQKDVEISALNARLEKLERRLNEKQGGAK